MTSRLYPKPCVFSSSTLRNPSVRPPRIPLRAFHPVFSRTAANSPVTPSSTLLSAALPILRHYGGKLPLRNPTLTRRESLSPPSSRVAALSSITLPWNNKPDLRDRPKPSQQETVLRSWEWMLPNPLPGADTVVIRSSLSGNVRRGIIAWLYTTRKTLIALLGILFAGGALYVLLSLAWFMITLGERPKREPEFCRRCGREMRVGSWYWRDDSPEGTPKGNVRRCAGRVRNC